MLETAEMALVDQMLGRELATHRTCRGLRISAVALCLITQLVVHLEPGQAQQASIGDPRKTALSLVGEPKLKSGDKHFEWVNPNAPKGGAVKLWAQGSFDSLNNFAVGGNKARGLALIYDQLMADSPDEPSTEYCLVCEWVSHPPDFSSVTFGLRKEARFDDGKPITADDVIYSFNALKRAHPFFRAYYRNVAEVIRGGDHEVTFRFSGKGNRELPQIMGQLYILPKHYWEANRATGEPRDVTKSTLEAPIGSGPYRIKSVLPGKEVVFERVKDWWAKDLPISRGQWNFDELQFTYFLDKTPAFEAFKVGTIDFWEENSATWWATRFDFGAVRRGLVKQQVVPTSRVAGMQAFVFNTRRPQFQDRRVREAFTLALDFEWANRSVFYSQYKRLASYFDNSELAATGVPQGKEREILESVRELAPAEVFGPAWRPPTNGSRTDVRTHLAEASKLLDAAGWRLDATQQSASCGALCTIFTTVGFSSGASRRLRRNTQGQTLSVEFLLVSSSGGERIVLPYIQNLALLGIEARVRTIDTAQYSRRVQNFDFDIVTGGFSQSNSPGNEQRDFFGSGSADQPGSRNIAGIKNPAVDQVIERIVFATDRAELVAATRALDRVLTWNFYMIPQWYLPADRIAFWQKFGQPPRLPSQDDGFLRSWWIDAGAAAKVEAELGR